MKFRHTIGWLLLAGLLLFSDLAQGRQVPTPSAACACFDQEEIYRLNSPGVATEGEAIALPTLTAPFPVYYFLTLTFTYHLDTYKKRLFFFKACAFISPFLRNIFYVFISIHAP